MDAPRICIIGAGGLSSRRIYPYIAPAGGLLAGVCDLDEEKAARNAALYGGVVYSDFRAMLEAECPDGVVICIGPQAHAELAPVVLDMGYPVYTEKPPASDAASALEVARAAERAGLLCMTAFKKRYNTAYARARQWLEGFEESDWLSLSVDYASGGYGSDGEGFLHDFCIHAIDLVGYLFGDAEEAFCMARGREAYAVSLRFANGAVGSLNLTCGRSFAVPTEEVELTVRGGNSMSIHNSSCWRISEAGKPGEWREPPTFVSAGDSGNETGHLAELVAFVDALRAGRTTARSQAYQSYKSMVLYEAIGDSAESGEPIAVRYEPL